MNEPTIPLRHSEMLHVAMSTMVHVLNTRTSYPVDNMESVLLAYRNSRDKYLAESGYTAEQVSMFTEAATEALCRWLDEREERKAEAAADFDAWAREVLDE